MRTSRLVLALNTAAVTYLLAEDRVTKAITIIRERTRAKQTPEWTFDCEPLGGGIREPVSLQPNTLLVLLRFRCLASRQLETVIAQTQLLTAPATVVIGYVAGDDDAGRSRPGDKDLVASAVLVGMDRTPLSHEDLPALIWSNEISSSPIIEMNVRGIEGLARIVEASGVRDLRRWFVRATRTGPAHQEHRVAPQAPTDPVVLLS